MDPTLTAAAPPALSVADATVAGQDYTAANGTLTFAAGDTSKMDAGRGLGGRSLDGRSGAVAQFRLGRLRVADERRRGDRCVSLPYVDFKAMPRRLALWAAGGYGVGGLTLTPAGGSIR